VMWSYTPETLSDPEILSLAKKISVYEDKEAEAEFPVKNGCIVNIKNKKGDMFSKRIKDPKGSPKNLLTLEDVKQKFLQNTIPIIGNEKADEFYETLLGFSELSSIRKLNPSFANAERMTAKL